MTPEAWLPAMHPSLLTFPFHVAACVLYHNPIG